MIGVKKPFNAVMASKGTGIFFILFFLFILFANVKTISLRQTLKLFLLLTQ